MTPREKKVQDLLNKKKLIDAGKKILEYQLTSKFNMVDIIVRLLKSNHNNYFLATDLLKSCQKMETIKLVID